MAEDIDYEEVLDGTVDEVKEAIDDLDDADYEELLDTEENGDDRKTVKEYVESSMESEGDDESEETAEENSESEEDSESEETEKESSETEEEEIVEDIEEETKGGFLGSFSREAVMAGGLAVGVLIGIVASSYMMPAGGGGASPASVKEDVRVILTGGQPVNGTVDISDPVRRHGMYFLNASVERDMDGETQTQTQGVYVTLDGEKLIPVREQLGRTLMPIDVESTLSQIEAQSQTDSQPSTGQTPESGQSNQAEQETQTEQSSDTGQETQTEQSSEAGQETQTEQETESGQTSESGQSSDTDQETQTEQETESSQTSEDSYTGY